ncbi:DUF6562 domain-containing protein, partial [Bacteroides eggerthii]
MKKSILNIVMAAFISCFAACSEEEIIATQDGTPKEVTVVAQVPNNATTRSVGVDNVIGNDQLRCILSVVKNDDKSEITRIEKLVNAEDTQISFTFTVGSNVEYSCLFWADYVDKSASKTGEKYTDKYYNTANMQAICVNADAENPANNAKLFNNPAADAFCGVLSNSQIKDADILNITLKRPFAKLNLTPKTEDDWKEKVGTMDIEFEMPGEFNMIAGSAAGTKTLVKAIGVKKEAGKYFSTFLFVENPETAKFNSDIKIVLTEDGTETPLPEKVIEKGFTVKPNYEINGGVNLSTQEEIKVDVDIDGKPEDPNAPKVGDYFYTDGTWSTELDETRTVAGVIFDLAADDALENYPGSNLQDKIRGWIVALNDISGKWYSGTSNLTSNNLTNTIEGVVVLASLNAESVEGELLGYKNSKAITAVTTDTETFPVNTGCTNWTATITNNATSGWYLPSIAQLQRLYQAEVAISNKLTAANGTAINTGVYLSSTLYKTNTNTFTPL